MTEFGGGAAAQQAVGVRLEVFSDFICPWCHIAARRLAVARERLAGELTLDVVWRPFELNPDMPSEGEDRRRYRSAKFGSWEQSQALDAGTEEAGAPDGVRFRYDLVTRTPNTFPAHRVVAAALSTGRQDVLVERLFTAYFAEGRDVSDRGVLGELAAASGLPAQIAHDALASADVERDVRDQEARAHAVGLRGVPHHVVDSRYAFSGAVSADDLVRVLRQSAS